jgi:uncharacterized membrane protein
MQFDSGVLSPVPYNAMLALSALLLLLAIPGLKALRGHPERLHLLLGSAVALAALWSVNARVDPGIALHLLGIPTVVLVLGWRLGVLAAGLAACSLPLTGAATAALAPVGWLMSAALPGAVIFGIARAVRFHLPRNPFVFIFGCAFFGSAAAMLVTWLAGAALLALSGQPSPSGPGSSLAAFLPLVMFPEAFVNGALVSMLIVYQPGWVRLYDERFYSRAG